MSATLHQQGSETVMVMDFGVLKSFLKPLVEDYLDHYFLNESLNLESPTSEAIAAWIFQQLQAKGLPGLHSVEIFETCTSSARYYAPELTEIGMMITSTDLSHTQH